MKVFSIQRLESDGPCLFWDVFATRALAEQAVAEDLAEWPGLTADDYEITEHDVIAAAPECDGEDWLNRL